MKTNNSEPTHEEVADELDKSVEDISALLSYETLTLKRWPHLFLTIQIMAQMPKLIKMIYKSSPLLC